MLDCIKRTVPAAQNLFDKAQSNTDELVLALGERINHLSEINIISSGSSHNAALTASLFMEKVSGLQVHSYVPNDFKRKSVLPKDALYIFVSQSGTSTLLEKTLRELMDKGCFTVAVTDFEDSPISTAASTNVPLLVGNEEFGYRTVGFCCSIIVLQLIAMRIGLETGKISTSEYNDYIEDGRKAIKNHPQVVEKTLSWFEKYGDRLKESNSVIYYGSDSLFGIAVEGALKLLETAKLYLSIGYEAEDGLHGPNLGFNEGDTVIALCDGIDDVDYAQSVVRFGKAELGQAYMFGAAPLDEDDLQFEIVSNDFKAIEVAPAVEIIAYELAMINDVPVEPSATRTPHSSAKYFQMHSK